MVERFYDMKVCIEKALIDIKSEVKFTDHEWSIMKDLITSLQPFKLAVETLCRRESTLLTADTVLKFIIVKLGQQDTVLSNDLSDVLREKIKERRTIVTGILTYLHNSKKYEEYLRQAQIHFLCLKKISCVIKIKIYNKPILK